MTFKGALDFVLANDRLFAVVVAVLAWLIKDVVFAIHARKSERLQTELRWRLTEVFNPLHLWSGVVCFDGPRCPEKVGVKELMHCLEKAANVLPLKTYATFVRLVECGMGQNTSPPTKAELLSARQYVYSRIEVINYVLYRTNGIDDLDRSLHPLSDSRWIMSFAFTALFHVALWLLIVAILWFAFTVIYGNIWATFCLAFLFLLVAWAEFQRRLSISREASRRLARK